jgi:hypothetical protein
MNDTSRSGTLRLPARGRRILAALSLLLTSSWLVLAVSTRRCEAQSLARPGQIDLLSVQSSVSRFYQTQAQLEQDKERERLNVPGYGSDLAKVVAEFQKHIVDMHFRHVTCEICKDHVKRIRQLAKSIEGAMN